MSPPCEGIHSLLRQACGPESDVAVYREWTLAEITPTATRLRAGSLRLDSALTAARLIRSAPDALLAAALNDLSARAVGSPSLSQQTDALRALLVATLGEYLDRKSELRYDAAMVESVIDDAAALVSGNAVPVVLIAPVRNIQTVENPIPLAADVIVRPVNQTELERWINTRPRPGGLRDADFTDLQVAIEIHDSSPPSAAVEEQYKRAQARLRSALVALSLHLDCAAREPFVERQRGALSAHRDLVVDLGQDSAPRVARLKRSDALPLAELWGALAETKPGDSVEIALRRWTDAASGTKAEEVLLDAWIALEALVLARGESPEGLRHRAALRISALIGHGPDERAQLYREIGQSYVARSKLVHGEATGKLDLIGIAGRTRDYLRRTLLAVLEAHGEYSPEQTEELLLRAFRTTRAPRPSTHASPDGDAVLTNDGEHPVG